MQSPTLPVFREAGAHSDQLRIDTDAAFHTTLQWLRIDSQGYCTQNKEEKGAVVARLRVPFRDLRILDPMLPTPYPTAIYIRERALVVNLQSVRVIITAEFAYVISVPNPQHHDHAMIPTVDSPFVKELMQRVSSRTSTLKGESAHSQVDNDLPFELKALEAALTHALLTVEEDAVNLHKQISPMLKKLSFKVEKGCLNDLRDAKAALNKQAALVASVKQELEDLLDDDQDMEDMYLARRRGEEAMLALHHMAYIAQTHTQRPHTQESADPRHSTRPLQAEGQQVQQHQQQPWQQQEQHATSDQDQIPPNLQPQTQQEGLPVSNMDISSSDMKLHPTALFERASTALHQRHSAASDDPLQYRPDFHEAPRLLGRLESMGKRGRQRSSAYVDPRDIEGCEALLEAHFTQADFTLRRLQQLKERIMGTESLVAIELDSRRNELVALNLIVVIITVMFAFVSMVAGIFGQNLHFGSVETGTGVFLAVTISSLAAAGLLCFVLLAYARYKRLLLIPSGPEGPNIS